MGRENCRRPPRPLRLGATPVGTTNFSRPYLPSLVASRMDLKRIAGRRSGQSGEEKRNQAGTQSWEVITNENIEGNLMCQAGIIGWRQIVAIRPNIVTFGNWAEIDVGGGIGAFSLLTGHTGKAVTSKRALDSGSVTPGAQWAWASRSRSFTWMLETRTTSLSRRRISNSRNSSSTTM